LTAFDGFQQTCRFRQLECATVLYWLPYTGMGVIFTTGGGKRCALFEVSVEPRRGMTRVDRWKMVRRISLRCVHVVRTDVGWAIGSAESNRVSCVGSHFMYVCLWFSVQ
jgi:hypothetical protein